MHIPRLAHQIYLISPNTIHFPVKSKWLVRVPAAPRARPPRLSILYISIAFHCIFFKIEMVSERLPHSPFILQEHLARSVVLKWIVQHAVDTINRHIVGHDSQSLSHFS